MIEIRIHGTGGQGTVIAGKLLAEAAARSGYQVQSFAAYGAERRGGKVESYVRISDTPVLVHARMYSPNIIVLMDEALAMVPGPTTGLQENGILLINSAKTAACYSTLGNFNIVTVNAQSIATRRDVLLPDGMPIINTTVLGALVGLITEIKLDHLITAIVEGKVPKPDKNISAARDAYHWVISEQAVIESDEDTACLKPNSKLPQYKRKKPPCEVNCPAGHVIHKTIAYLQKNRFEEALENIRKENPFPGICGRVCFHPCELDCNAKEFTGTLAVNALERAAYDHGSVKPSKKSVQKKRSGKTVAIVGSGPSGMTCAYFLARMGHSVTIFEALPVPGGIPRVAIPEYRLPDSVVANEIGHILALNVNLIPSTRVGHDISFDDIAIKYDACFIASGAHRSIKLNIPGEDQQRVISGLAFLKKLRGGDKLDLATHKVAIVGGGNTAVDAARSAIRLGAEEVTIIYRRSRAEMPANQEELVAAEKEGIMIHYLAAPIEIHGRNGRISDLECLQTRLVETGNTSRQRPEIIENSNFRLPADYVIIAIGEAADTAYLPDKLEMNGPLIKVDELGRTSIRGLYAGGDVAHRAWNVPEAIGSGKRAAIGIDMFLQGNDITQMLQLIENGISGTVSASDYLAGNPVVTCLEEVRFNDLNPHYFAKTEPTQIPERTVQDRQANFVEVKPGLTKTAAIEEARRCFHCGNCNLCENCYILCPDTAISVNEDHLSLTIDSRLCKGCGICITECPRSAVSWEGELG